MWHQYPTHGGRSSRHGARVRVAYALPCCNAAAPDSKPHIVHTISPAPRAPPTAAAATCLSPHVQEPVVVPISGGAMAGMLGGVYADASFGMRGAGVGGFRSLRGQRSRDLGRRMLERAGPWHENNTEKESFQTSAARGAAMTALSAESSAVGLSQQARVCLVWSGQDPSSDSSAASRYVLEGVRQAIKDHAAPGDALNRECGADMEDHKEDLAELLRVNTERRAALLGLQEEEKNFDQYSAMMLQHASQTEARMLKQTALWRRRQQQVDGTLAHHHATGRTIDAKAAAIAGGNRTMTSANLAASVQLLAAVEEEHKVSGAEDKVAHAWIDAADADAAGPAASAPPGGKMTCAATRANSVRV